MRTISSAAVVLAVVLALACAPAQAAVQVGDQVQFYNGVGNPGGVFHVDDLNDAGLLNFDTFCVELTEGIRFGPTYTVDGIGLTTVNGAKTISSYTAWLYTGFLEGTLNAFNATSVSDVNALQLAIWQSIGYTAADVASAISTSWYNTYNTVLSGKTWAADFAASGFTGYGAVRVMNLRTATGGYAQDQLVHIIPEPFSFVVWALIAVCAGTVRGGRD